MMPLRTGAALGSDTPETSSRSKKESQPPVGGTTVTPPVIRESMPASESIQPNCMVLHAAPENSSPCWSPLALHTGAPSTGQTYDPGTESANDKDGASKITTTAGSDRKRMRASMAGLRRLVGPANSPAALAACRQESRPARRAPQVSYGEARRPVTASPPSPRPP